jgi:hypothetical protein
MDEPSMIYRCAAAGPGTENEYLSNANPVTYYGTLTFAQSSAVTGGSMVLFGGGTANNTFSGGQLGYQQYTIEFWVNPTTAAPPATRTIMAGRGPDESTIIWRLNQLITTGKLEMYHRNSTGTYETIVFNYTPVASTTVLVAIVVDKVNAVAKVYENGVLKDTQSVLTGYLDVIYLDYNNESTWNYKYLHIGGFRTAGGTISQAFFGKLGEITFYTRALTPDRLLSHYDSRTLI